VTRVPRNKRVSGFPRMVLTERDKQIVRSVHENRFLKRDQIERLFFTTTTATNGRLLKLYQHHFLDRLYLPVDVGSSQAVYALDRAGVDLVASELGVPKSHISWRRKHNRVEFFFLEHTVGVAELNVALQVALHKREDIELLFWRREVFLPREKVQDPEDWEGRIHLLPDAFFGLALPHGRSFFFVEVDMGTETLERYRRKVVAYQQYWRSGAYHERYGYKNFRVLTIAEGAERLGNLIRVAGGEGAKNMFLFATSRDVSSRVPEPIWFKPNTQHPITILD
jgi:hypothetical protein